MGTFWQDLWRKWQRPVPPVVVVPPAPVPDDDAELLRQHNLERVARSVPPLSLEVRLDIAAKRHAAWMYRTGRVSHTGEVGSSFSQRVAREGYQMMTGGENVAAGQRTATEVVSAWMNSPGHRANVLGRSFVHVGFGRSGNYWCVVLASPAGHTRTLTSEPLMFLPGPLVQEPPPTG